MTEPPDDTPPPIRDLGELLRSSYKFLGYSAAAVRLGLEEQQLYGKWCHRCNGLWFGLALEVSVRAAGIEKVSVLPCTNYP